MRGAAVAVFAFFAFSCFAATPTPGEEEHAMERVGLRSIAGWLKMHGTEGYLGAEVAHALGVAPAGGGQLDARQRGFRNGGVLRIAQLLPDGSVLFMMQDAGGELTFYHSTLRDGLRRALLSVPGRGLVQPLGGREAESRFRAEVLYWEDKAANR
jgi:hypothetical protein